MFRRFIKSTLLTLAFIIILFIAACSPMAMKRESGPAKSPDLIIQPGDLAQALDLSLAYGDGRRVNWQAVGFN
jgi:hypothetical protein